MTSRSTRNSSVADAPCSILSGSDLLHRLGEAGNGVTRDRFERGLSWIALQAIPEQAQAQVDRATLPAVADPAQRLAGLPERLRHVPKDVVQLDLRHHAEEIEVGMKAEGRRVDRRVLEREEVRELRRREADPVLLLEH